MEVILIPLCVLESIYKQNKSNGGVGMKAIVVINETHKLFPEQEKLLVKRFGDYELLKSPKSGWSLEEIEEIVAGIEDVVVFASPIPAFMSLLATEGKPFFVFHNDRREKLELPDGRVIMKIAAEGWQIV